MGNMLQKPKQNYEKTEKREENEGGDHASSFTCEICIEPVSFDKKFKNKWTCRHRSYCLDCMEKHIQGKVEEYNISNIKCPGLGCDELLDPLSCRPILSAKVFERWCDALCESTLLKLHTTYCPSPNCSSLILNECGKNVTKSTCPICKKLFCFKCERPWHAGYSCRVSKEMGDSSDILFLGLMGKRKWQRCPICKHCVERVFGCKIMSCRCGVQFCYVCGKKAKHHRCRCEENIDDKILCIGALVLFGIFCINLYFEPS